MHATVPEEDALKHECVLQEGNICIITNFNVGSAKNILCPVNNIHMIFFKWDIVAKLMNDQSNNFPMYMFSFKPFNAISSGYEETQNTTDVIGILISMSYIKEGTTSVSKRKDIIIQNERYMIRIQVEDSTHSISLVVFDKLAEKLILDIVEKLVDMEKQDNGSELIKEELKKLIGVSFTFEIKITLFNLKDQNKSFTVSKNFHIDRDIQIGGIHENVQKDQIGIDQQDKDCSEENVLISKMVTSDKTNTKSDTNDALNDRSTLTYKSKRIKRTTYKKQN
ncbi:hypothetical protein IFM89_023306 [Coptis chinensis]|uniref:Uncharacterized protein n=1 Tax=Coptis chinensis TaxID=261450 RepID=A0A835LED4_9MAGN|nr:hypothetical protein IFM89_023306 [Coptis chinensis]